MSQDISVLLTFDVDAESLWLARDPESANKPVWLSQGTYGPREGIPRILALLDRFDIPSTFFVPGVVVEWHRAAISSVVDAGHEIGHHSYTHTWAEKLSVEQERDEMAKGMEILEKLTGKRPRGWRSPAAEFTRNTVGLLEEFGFEYSSNMFDADSPYLLKDGERTTSIIEFPFAWLLDDAPFWLYSNRLQGRSMAAPSAVLETWTREFDGLAEEEGRCLVLGMHPQVIGRPSRMWVLRKFVEHVLEHGGARFTTLGALTDELQPELLAAQAGQ